jgi:hypothetical protein
MYRARVGIDLIPNRYIHDKAVSAWYCHRCFEFGGRWRVSN